MAEWSVVTLDGDDAAFAGATIDLLATGAPGTLAFGRDDASGLPVGWASEDGRSWQDLDLPPTTFGGGVPRMIVYGPAGWLALGWHITLEDPFGTQLWRSSDGAAWQAVEGTSETSLPLQQLVGFAGGYVGWAEAPEGEGPPRFWRSIDGQQWTAATGPPVFRVDQIVVVGDALVANGAPLGAENSEWWPWGLWRSTDGAEWREIPVPPGSEIGSPEGIAIAPGTSGLLVGIPEQDSTGEISRVVPWLTDNLETWREGALVPNVSDFYSLSFDRLGDGWIATVSGSGQFFSADGGAWTALGPIVDQSSYWPLVHLRSGEVLSLTASGDRIVPGSILTQEPGSGSAIVVTGAHDPRPASDPNRVALAIREGVDCPKSPRTVKALAALPAWKAATCFGHQRLRLEGWAQIEFLDCSDACPTKEGVFDTAVGIALGSRGAEEYQAWYDPATVKVPKRVRTEGFGEFHVIVEGSFDSPAAEGCASDGNPPAAAVLECQERFVITNLKVIS